MPHIELYQTMARYNQWMNERHYAVCAEIDDQERKRDQGAFFKSIHTTLNHLLFGDCAWMSRFTGRTYRANAIDENIYEDFEELRSARVEMDREILDWTSDLTEEWLSGTLTWSSSVDGIARTRDRWLCVSHLFNHQTHHRGQITTLLSQGGHDIGSTDLPWTPGL